MTSTPTTRTRSKSSAPEVRYGVALETPPEMTVEVERVSGQSYVAHVRPLGARIMFREVRTDRELSADVQIAIRGRHVMRTGSVSLGMRSRSEIARTAHELSGASDLATWKRGVFMAAERVLESEERLGGGVDLRAASTDAGGELFAVAPTWFSGPTTLTAPGKLGKSTLARAWAMSIVTGAVIIPGCVPKVRGPVLYVAAEAPVVASHARSIEAISRGLGISRSSLAHEIRMERTGGRSLHRIARSLAEMANDFAAVVLDSYQALQSAGDNGQGIRDRDTMFWSSLDQFERPVLIVAHPNAADRVRWAKAKDGRPAGSDVARDRSRMNWKADSRDDKAVEGERYRHYTLSNTWFNDGPTQPTIRFGLHWVLGRSVEDPGTARFMDPAEHEPPDEPEERPATAGQEVNEDDEIGPAMRSTLDAWRAGIRTPGALRKVDPGISIDTAKMRIKRLKDSGLLRPDELGLGE